MSKLRSSYTFFIALTWLSALVFQVDGFGLVASFQSSSKWIDTRRVTRSTSALRMSDAGGGGGGGGGNMDRQRSTKKGLQTITIDKTKAEQKEEKKDESEWRVILHNDEVHTFEYVVNSLVKVIGTIDKKKAWDICVLTHGNGKATVTKSWKQQSEKYCLGLQRQGLTVSIAPDDNFNAGNMPNDLGNN